MLSKSAANRSSSLSRANALAEVHPEYRSLRAEYTLQYWRHSGSCPKRVPSCIGWGFSERNGRVVESETTVVDAKRHRHFDARKECTKRIKTMEEE
jgi:hypothetical protein